MDIMRPKSPSDLPGAEHLRRQAADLKGKAERFLKEADALLAEAERLDKSAKKKAPREDFSQAAARIVREATDKA
jgi:hypothetical protein